MPTKKEPNIVVIGGGTGSFTLLQALKNHTSQLTALVNMADDGGSTGILRDELGVLPPGDVRQCLVALSESSELRDLFDYRFEQGSLAGHSFGNLFLSALEKITNDFSQAVYLAGEMLRIKGAVLPTTTTPTHLVAELTDGTEVSGEFKIAGYDFSLNPQPKLGLRPSASLNPPARGAAMAADLIVIAPGSLYGSLAPALLVRGMGRALKHSKAKVAYVCNLVTKPKQTDGFKVHDYAAELERFVDAPILDFVIYNTARPAKRLLTNYIHEGEYLVGYDVPELAKQRYQAIGLPLIAKRPVKLREGDMIAQARSLIRHDGEVIAAELVRLAQFP